MAKKLQLGYKDIEARLETLKSKPVPASEVGYEILKAFGKSDKDISRYKEGKGILKTFEGLLIKGLFCYRQTDTLRLTEELENLKCDEHVRKASPKIIAVSDGKTVLAYDTREKDTYEQQLAKMHSDFGFFYPLMNVERVHVVAENPADVKAAEKLAKLHDEIRAYNEYNSDDDLHDLNIFITRLLFCFFAEDTGIFEENLFTNFIRRFTKNDGSDLSEMLAQAFRVMNIKVKDRSEEITKEINDFPYVNGGLFANDIPIPMMGYKARKIIIECGELDWKDINPDIFGSMIQAVVNPDVRAKEGMHYTSVPNIMKVINPLFLDDLRGEYKKLVDLYEQKKNLHDMSVLSYNQFLAECKPIINGCNRLMTRMGKMKFFDPACGSGNFLIITYKQLRLLEMDILHLRKKCTPEQALDFIDGSCIRLDQFYGIELLDFPHEVAMLSLWLAEHQMNNKFHADFGVNVAALPLKNINQIKCANACRVDWNEVCPHTKEEEVFVFGNPPYLGYSKQIKQQKEDLAIVCGSIGGYSKLDYISCWFVKGSKFILNSKSSYAFVTTNSITQGEQVALLWPYLLEKLKIVFAYKSFMWKNNAKNNAMVAVSIIGVVNNDVSRACKLYDASNSEIVTEITPYLTKGKKIYVRPCSYSISGFPEMIKGCSPVDDGNLLMDSIEKNILIEKYPMLSQYVKKYLGADEFVHNKERFCFWFDNTEIVNIKIIPLLEATVPEFKAKIEKVKIFRERSSKSSTREFASVPYLFIERKYRPFKSIVVPQTGSEKRKYLPMGIADENTVLSNAVRLIYCENEYDMKLFGIISSYLHMVWVRAVAGRMKTDMQYSNTICYNTFPFPPISSSKKSEIEEAATDILLIRAEYPEKTLADLYDPDKMPRDLLEAHEKLDRIVESCYPGAPFANDEARLECLFKLYEKMTANKNNL